MNILRIVDAFVTDCRVAVRGLSRSPGFTGLVVLSLALGVGVDTAIFAVSRTVLLRPLPYPEPDRLVVISETTPGPEGPGSKERPMVNFLAQRDRLRSYEGVMGIGGAYSSGKLVGGTEPREITLGPVAAAMCTIFRIEPQIGRCFTADEEEREPRVALVSHRFWQQQFGGDPAIAGRTMTLRGDAGDADTVMTIIGVMPETFRLYSSSADVWIPVAPNGNFTWGHTVGRLKPGIDIQQALAEARLLQQTLLPNDHEGLGGLQIQVRPLLDQVVEDSRTGLWILLAAASMVLLIACANIASLLLVRGTASTRELAVRAALGAGRLRVCGKLLTESLLLAGAGGVVGAFGASWILEGIRAVASSWLPRMNEVRMDWTVFSFAAFASLVSALLFGLLPSLRLSRLDLASAMKGGGPGSIGGHHHHKVMNALVVFQTAICLVAMVGAGLLINTVVRLRTVESGIDPRHTASVGIVATRPATAGIFIHDVLESVRAVPGVKAVGTVNIPPVFGGAFPENFRLPGMVPGTYRLEAASSIVSPGYFEAIGTPILLGRSFSDLDTAGTAPVAVVSNGFARRYWPDGKAVGQRIILPGRRAERTYEVIGVAADVRSGGLRERPDDHIYKTYAQGTSLGTKLIVRTTGDVSSILVPLKQAIRSIDKEQTLDDFKTLESELGELIQEPHFYMTLLGSFAGLSLMLTALGVGGLTAYAVSRRTREIGLRLSFGATPASLLRLFGGGSLKLTIAGLLIGTTVSLVATEYLRSLLYEITPTDPLTFVAVAVLLTTASMAASWAAARRATTVDPAIILREE